MGAIKRWTGVAWNWLSHRLFGSAEPRLEQHQQSGSHSVNIQAGKSVSYTGNLEIDDRERRDARQK